VTGRRSHGDPIGEAVHPSASYLSGRVRPIVVVVWASQEEIDQRFLQETRPSAGKEQPVMPQAGKTSVTRGRAAHSGTFDRGRDAAIRMNSESARLHTCPECGQANGRHARSCAVTL
jgi:hypothetical protein